MSVEHVIEAAPDGSSAALLRVRCTGEQARVLGTLLDRSYPGRRHAMLPLMGPEFTHSCLVHDTPEALRQKWPVMVMKLMLGPASKQRESGERRPAPAVQAPIVPAAPAPAAQAGNQDRPLPMQPPAEPESMATTEHEASAFGARLAIARLLPLDERCVALERLYDAAEPATIAAGVLLARTYAETGAHTAAATLYEVLQSQVEGPATLEVREGLAQSLLALGRHADIVERIPPAEVSPRLRGALGVAQYHAGDMQAAATHLEYAWRAPAARTPPVALALARLYWRYEHFHDAAAPYRIALEAAPENLELSPLEAADFAAVVELARCGEYDELPESRVLDCIFAYCARAGLHERATEDSHNLVAAGLDLARRLGDPQHLARAYHLMIDDLLQRHQGKRLVELLQEAEIDHHQNLLTAALRFDLLDALADHLMDYRQLLRQPLIDGYQDLLLGTLEQVDTSEPLPADARDSYRSLYDLDRRNPLCDRYRRMMLSRQAGHTERADDTTVPAGLAGKRIAIVGGHDSTRFRVRERLQQWGARMDEVPPPTNGRISEREILDRVRLSDLVLLVVTYMGHDMSTIVNNLASRGALHGQVLAVECRGASGVTRAIAEWAEAS